LNGTWTPPATPTKPATAVVTQKEAHFKTIKGFEEAVQKTLLFLRSIITATLAQFS
jgi:hypothetical protein